MLIAIGTLVLLFGVILLVAPRIMWPLTEFSNRTRGIKVSEPNEYYDMMTRIQGVIAIVMGIIMFALSYPELQRMDEESWIADVLSSISIANNDGVLEITNNTDKKINLTLQGCSDGKFESVNEVMDTSSYAEDVNLSQEISPNGMVKYHLVPRANSSYSRCYIYDQEGGNDDTGKRTVECTTLIDSLYCERIEIIKGDDVRSVSGETIYFSD